MGERRERVKRDRYFKREVSKDRRKEFLEKFEKRRSSFKQVLQDELDLRKKIFNERMKQLQKDHQIAQGKLSEALKKKKAPPQGIWPKRGW